MPLQKKLEHGVPCFLILTTNSIGQSENCRIGESANWSIGQLGNWWISTFLTYNRTYSSIYKIKIIKTKRGRVE